MTSTSTRKVSQKPVVCPCCKHNPEENKVGFPFPADEAPEGQPFVPVQLITNIFGFDQDNKIDAEYVYYLECPNCGILFKDKS